MEARVRIVLGKGMKKEQDQNLVIEGQQHLESAKKIFEELDFKWELNKLRPLL